MKEAIATREVIALAGTGPTVRGTYHKTRSGRSNSELINQERLGLVFFPGLMATRASKGDAAVFWADAFAERGYPSFRLDLPGWGDSDGEPPSEPLDFVNAGGYASIAAAKVRELMAAFNLSGVVLCGHCSGAITAISTAMVSRECKGLVLMDPYFDLPQTSHSKARRDLHDWALQNRLATPLRILFNSLKELSLLFRGNALPENANFQLLHQWQDLMHNRLPVLVLAARSQDTKSTKKRIGEFDYLKYLHERAGRGNELSIEVLEGVGHSFATLRGRTAVAQHVANWLNTFFPIVKDQAAKVNTSAACCG